MELATDIMAIWREDFEKQLKKVGYVNAHLEKNNIGNYLDFEVGSMFRGFLMAKRNMQVIEIPQGHLMDDPDGMGSGRYLMIETVERALNRAGYQFTIKGE